MQPEIYDPNAAVHDPAEVLSQLGLDAAELSALGRQGFVCQESRGPGRVYYKLRFRRAGKQQVRSLGSDSVVAGAIRQALADWQATTRLDRKLGQLARAAKRALRGLKPRLEPKLSGAGFAFHGLAIRRPQLPQPSVRGEQGCL